MVENSTKNKLSVSLRKLLLKKNIDKITVGEIAKEAGVNRQTFYYHFQDIYDLIEWIYMNEIIQELKIINFFDDWQKSCDFILNYILKNQNFISKTYKISSLKSFIYGEIYSQIYHEIKDSNIDVDIDFVTRFYSHAFIGIIGDWIKNGMKEPVEELIKNMGKIINSTRIS